MSYLSEHQRKFNDLRVCIEEQNRSQLKAKSNGGNTILFVYPPSEEQLYLKKAQLLFPDAVIIDLSVLLVQYIDEIGWEDFKEFYQAYATSTYQVFKSDGAEEDFFALIIKAIQKAFDDKKTPFLLRTGILYGTGIKNLNIMEHKMVMNHSTPLVVFYPARQEKKELLFLNASSGSTYRCTVID